MTEERNGAENLRLPGGSRAAYHYKEKCLGRGEVWFKGSNVTKGYFKQPSKTKEVFVDGWFRWWGASLQNRPG